MSFLAIATCMNLPEPDLDEDLLLDALSQRGVPARMVAWDDPSVDWTAPRLTILRSTWNYYRQPEAFVAWVESLGRRVLNEPHVVAWNHHKRYLRDLEHAGMPVVPTLWLARGSAPDVATLVDEKGWGDVVLKPAISAGSFRTSRLSASRFEADLVRALLADADGMVQPYVTSVDTYGERSVVVIDGEISHAIRKSPRFLGDSEEVSGLQPIAEDERVIAEKILALGQLVGEPLYARIDIVRDEAHRPMLSEVELIEPSLFLRQHPPALERFADAIARRYGALGRP